MRIHYVPAAPGSIVRHDLSYRVGLFTDDDYAGAFDAAGLRHRLLGTDTLMRRGLYVSSRSPLRSLP